MFRSIEVASVLFSISIWSLSAVPSPACGWWGDDDDDLIDDAITVVPSDTTSASLTPTDPEMMVRLSVAYRTGDGVEQNDNLAFEWARAAAEAGHPGAMNDLGQMYEIGFISEINDAAAVRWYQKAADLGIAAAQHSLASMLRYGRGAELDKLAADRWLRTAAEHGHPSAAGELASLIWYDQIDVGVPTEGCFWWLVAIRQGLDVSPERCFSEQPEMSEDDFDTVSERANAWMAEDP